MYRNQLSKTSIPLLTRASVQLHRLSNAKGACWILAIGYLAYASSTFAQTEPPVAAPDSTKPEPAATEPTTADKDSDAGQSSEAAPETPSVTSAEAIDPYAEAKEHFSTGVKLYDAGNFDAALTEFTQAYQQMAGHPGQAIMLRNMGKAQEALFFYDDAIHSYRGYLKLAPTAKDVAEVKKNIELLERFLGKVKLSIQVKGGVPPKEWQVWVSGRKLVENSLELRLTPGTHEIEVKAQGYSIGKAQLSVVSGKQEEVNIELEVLAEEYRGLPQPYFWTAAGITAATAITGGVFGALAQLESNSVKNKIAEGPPESLSVSEDDQKKIDNLALAADICFVTAGVFAAGTVILGVLTDWDSGEDADEQIDQADQTAWQRVTLDAAPLPSGAWLTVGGTF